MLSDRCLFLFLLSLFPHSLLLSPSLFLDWWNCQWFITNVSGRRSRVLFCPCQSQVEPEVGSFAYQSKSHSSCPTLLSVQNLLDHQLSNPELAWLDLVPCGSSKTNRKWCNIFRTLVTCYLCYSLEQHLHWSLINFGSYVFKKLQ